MGSRSSRVLAAILVGFLAVSIAGAFTAPLEWDEGSYLLNAEYFQGEGHNFESSRPAALSLAVSALWEVTGESTVAARILVVLSGVAAVLIFYLIASKEFDRPLPLTAGFAFAPLLLYWSFHVYTDVPALALLLASLYLYRRERHLAAGVTMAAAVTFRYLFALFAALLGERVTRAKGLGLVVG
ncbi:MAG: hypothetical protein ABEI07_00595, partial [Candidatus Nanohaloarchaea archaeon]